MVVQEMPDNAIQELLALKSPRAIRLIFSEKHSVILKQITDEERSISEIARALSLNPGSVHYYLKELEKQGLARQVRQEIKGGIVKKYYRAAARHMVPAAPDFESLVPGQHLAEEETGEQLVRAMGRLGYHVPDTGREEAKELMLRYAWRVKELLGEINEGWPPDGEAHTPAALQLMAHIKALDDPELCRMHDRFSKLFLKPEA